MVNGIINFEFQNNCINFLIDKTLETDSKQVITVKAPTGAGKTVMLIKYVDEYLKNTNRKTAFVWLCPGKGDLEQQSMKKMDELTPQRDTRIVIFILWTVAIRWVFCPLWIKLIRLEDYLYVTRQKNLLWLKNFVILILMALVKERH